MEVLVEGKHKGRWRSRNPQNKLVFFNHPEDQLGKTRQIRITHAGPWSMSGELVSETQPNANRSQMREAIPLTLL